MSNGTCTGTSSHSHYNTDSHTDILLFAPVVVVVVAVAAADAAHSAVHVGSGTGTAPLVTHAGSADAGQQDGRNSEPVVDGTMCTVDPKYQPKRKKKHESLAQMVRFPDDRGLGNCFWVQHPL